MPLYLHTPLSWTFKVTVAVECERVDVDLTKAQVRMYVCSIHFMDNVCTNFHIV